MPYTLSLRSMYRRGVVALLFGIGDRVLSYLHGLKYCGLRDLARRKCLDWIIEHQEPEGDWAGIAMPMLCSIQALLLEGYSQYAPETCMSPHWDTVLIMTALCDANLEYPPPKVLDDSAAWVMRRQLTGTEGDWRDSRPNIQAGGFSFEYVNSWYPDVDDTAATIIALLKYDANLAASPTILRAAEWILGMQNDDGGWAAFDTNNNKLWLNKIPFSDMDTLCDPSTADITGRVLEAFGLLISLKCRAPEVVSILDRVDVACNKALDFIARQQDTSGAWWGRWGYNYPYGTSGVLCGLEYFAPERDDIRDMVRSAIAWIKSCQNPDGGWGEDLTSYNDRRLAGKGTSTPSQTAWALMGLLSHVGHDDAHVVSGVEYLVATQVCTGPVDCATWRERAYTGTGFPGHFYFGYEMYSHYFPMMALGRHHTLCSAVVYVESGADGV